MNEYSLAKVQFRYILKINAIIFGRLVANSYLCSTKGKDFLPLK